MSRKFPKWAKAAQRNQNLAAMQRALEHAYSEQERRTVDPVVKRAVRDGLFHFMAILTKDPTYQLPRITFADVDRMADDIRARKRA